MARNGFQLRGKSHPTKSFVARIVAEQTGGLRMRLKSWATWATNEECLSPVRGDSSNGEFSLPYVLTFDVRWAVRKVRTTGYVRSRLAGQEATVLAVPRDSSV